MLFPTFKQLAESGYIFRITDNGGATLDRLTVLFSDGDYLGMSWTGAGISQWGESLDPAAIQERVEAGEEIDLAPGDLCNEAQAHILARVNYGWHDCLIKIETEGAAATRDEAELNEGTHDSASKGIYHAGTGFCVRMDSDHAGDDRGPFMTAAEALRATLPDEYSLAGPEYQSGQNMQRVTKCRATERRRLALEKKVSRNA